MKKVILLPLLLLLSFFSYGQTATNFNANDCAGSNHDLFNELDAGKVVVICWVMPCSACIAPAQNAQNIVQSYSVSNPGQVVFYLVDDYGNSSCNTINNWAATNNITNYTSFSNSVISMSSYGANGMPKTVVLGGTGHTVYYNQNGTLNTTTFSTAINNALAGAPTAIGEISSEHFQTRVSPNPASDEMTFSFTAQRGGDIFITLYNLSGQEITTLKASCKPGNNEQTINVEDIAPGTYFARIGNANTADLLKVLIAR